MKMAKVINGFHSQVHCALLYTMLPILDGISEICAHVRNRNRCARKEQSLLFDLFKAPDLRAVTHYFSPKRPIFHHACATFSEAIN